MKTEIVNFPGIGRIACSSDYETPVDNRCECPGCGGPANFSPHYRFDRNLITFRCESDCDRCEEHHLGCGADCCHPHTHYGPRGIFSLDLAECPDVVRKILESPR